MRKRTKAEADTMTKLNPDEAPEGCVAVAGDRCEDCASPEIVCDAENREDGTEVVFWRKPGPGDRYIVIARDDRRMYRLLTLCISLLSEGFKYGDATYRLEMRHVSKYKV